MSIATASKTTDTTMNLVPRIKQQRGWHGRYAPVHGLYKTAIWRIWNSMLSRCHTPSHINFKFNGGRGIKVCYGWRRSFLLFIKDVGPRPGKQFSLERINNNGNYEPGNVRWATRADQLRNMRSNKWITFRGETLILTDMAAKYGLSLDAVRKRLKRGWPMEAVFTMPSDRNSGVFKKHGYG